MDQSKKGFYENYANECLQGKKASCVCACPFNMDIPSFNKKIQIKSYSGAYRSFREQVVFPEIVAKICPAPCMNGCVYKDEPLNMPLLEKICCEQMKNKKPNRYNMPKKPFRIAIIGAGLSGLTCALKLGMKSYDVVVYEKSDRIGGHLYDLLPESEFMPCIETQFQFTKYELVKNHEITDLSEITADAIYVATGEGGETFGLTEGMHEPSLSSNTDGVFIGGRAIGGGDMDAIFHGMVASFSIERYLQIKKMGGLPESFHVSDCEIPVPNKAKRVQPPQIKPASPEGYTPDESVEEASRCLDCRCTSCYEHCELMQYHKQYPRKLIGDAIVSLFPVAGLDGPRISTRIIAACQQCRACLDFCPKDIDMGRFFLDFRGLMVEDGSFPPTFHDFFLRDMEFARSESAHLCRKANGEDAPKYAFFPGCQLGGGDPEVVKKAYAYLQEKLPGTALMLDCCGVSAEWSGQQSLYEEHQKHLIEDWEALGRPTLILACANCLKVFKADMPQIPVTTLYEIMEEYGLPSDASDCGEMAVFDPCASRGNHPLQDAVRHLAEQAGITVTELAHSRDEAQCCSFGGHTHFANKELVDSTTRKRISESDLPYLAYCVNCRDTFAQAGKECRHILDVVLGVPTRTGVYTWTEKRENRIKLKAELLKEFWGEETDIASNLKERLTVSEELSKKLSDRFILEQDLLSAIDTTEASGRVIKNVNQDYLIAHQRIGWVTYWVQYRKHDDGTYEVLNAYSHKMRIEEEA